LTESRFGRACDNGCSPDAHDDGGGEVILEDAAKAILIAAGVNTASKAVMAATLGGPRLGSMVGALSVVSLVAMGVTFVALR